MSEPEAELTDVACPFLGLPNDPNSHFAFADRTHRCYAKRGVVPVDPSYQSGFCLTSQYKECTRFRAAERPVPTLARSTGATQAAPVPVTVTAGAPIAASKRRARSRRRVRAIRTVISVALILLVVIGGGVAVSFVLSLQPPSSAPRAGIRATQAPVRATPSASTEKLRSDSPSPSPSPSPTLAPPSPRGSVPSPTPIRSAPTFSSEPTARTEAVFHTVSRGETLGGIAGRYGVTVGAIVRANDNIEDPDVIYTGQRLIIPPPS